MGVAADLFKRSDASRTQERLERGFDQRIEEVRRGEAINQLKSVVPSLVAQA